MSWSGCYADITSPQSDINGYGYFKVNSVPESGEVIFDGKSYGYSPVLLKVETNSIPSHELIIKMNGYEDYSRDIPYNPKVGETIPISLDATHTMDHITEFLGSH